MSSINYAAREIIAKIVYAGPGLAGKTSNLQLLHDGTEMQFRGHLLTAGGPGGLFFDFLQMEAGVFHGLTLRLQLYAPSFAHDGGASLPLLLHGADGIVFVADSQISQVRANREAMASLTAQAGPRHLPWVMQLNKRDLADTASVSALTSDLAQPGQKIVEASTNQGLGVIETFQAIAGLVLQGLPHRT